MAPTWQSAEITVGDTSGVTANKPSGVQEGDLLIAHLRYSAPTDVTITPPSGWETIQLPFPADTTWVATAVYYRVATGSEPATYAWSLSPAAGTAARVVISRITGADRVNPINTSTRAIAGSTSCDIPQITTTVDDCLLMYCLSMFGGTPSVTPTSPYTARYGDTGDYAILKGGTAVQATAGNSPSASCSWSGSQGTSSSRPSIVHFAITSPQPRLPAIAHHYRQLRA